MQAVRVYGRCVFARVSLYLYHYLFILYEENNVAPECSVDFLCLFPGSVCRVPGTDRPAAGGSQ